MVSREHVYSQDAGTPPPGQAPLEHPLVQTGPLLLLAYKEVTCIVRGQVILREGPGVTWWGGVQGLVAS